MRYRTTINNHGQVEWVASEGGWPTAATIPYLKTLLHQQSTSKPKDDYCLGVSIGKDRPTDINLTPISILLSSVILTTLYNVLSFNLVHFIQLFTQAWPCTQTHTHQEVWELWVEVGNKWWPLSTPNGMIWKHCIFLIPTEIHRVLSILSWALR